MVIGDRQVGPGHPVLVIAEVGLAHDGSLGDAHAYIDAVADAGADAVKWQHHSPDHECAPDEPWRVPPRWPQDASRAAYWRRTAFTREQWVGLKEHADARGLLFLCSPFSLESVRVLRDLVPAWKVASGEIGNRPLLAALIDTGLPLLVSTGMATVDEIRELAFHVLPWRRSALMQCTSAYPTPAEQVGLRMIDWLRDLDPFRPVGFSDHSGAPWAGIAAVARGADIVEVHVKLSPYDQGFDAASALEIADLARLVEGIRFVRRALGPYVKDDVARDLAPMRDLFMGKAKRKAAYDAQRTA